MDLKILKGIRKSKKTSIKQISIDTGLSRNVISRIENGQGNPTFENVKLVADALGFEIRLLVKN